jgi:hypothetical protein
MLGARVEGVGICGDCTVRASSRLSVCFFVNPISVEEEEEDGEMMMNVY